MRFIQKLYFSLLLLGLVEHVQAADLRVGIVGCDTSHAVAFTETWNNPEAKGYVPGCKVVAAYRGGSADIPQSLKLQEEIIPKLKEKYGVKFYNSIEELCANVDVVCLESLDGRPKLEQIKPILKAGKPVFVDKPMGTSVAEVRQIFQLANQASVPIFTSSSLRFATNTQAVRGGAVGVVTNAETFGPCETDPHHPELYWYGLHGVEALFTVMGSGCQSVQRSTNAQGKIEVVGVWRDGRTGIFREDKDFHGKASGSTGELSVGKWDGYVPLVREITKFFQTRIPSVSQQETLEIYALMDAAAQSQQSGGRSVRLSELFQPRSP